MAFPIYGIAGTESPDKVGEQLSVDGADISDLTIFNDEHKNGCFATLGEVQVAKKIYKPQDCTDDYQLNCWNQVKKPFIYVYGNIVEGDHPNAAAARSLIQYSSENPNFNLGFSVEGATIKREGKRLSQTKILSASLTVRPMNSECKLFPVLNLKKSQNKSVLPEQYRDVESRKSFRNLPSLADRLQSRSVLMKSMMESLRLSDNMNNVTYMKCWNCGEGNLVMKERVPNRCNACKEGFTMQDIYRAKLGYGG